MFCKGFFMKTITVNWTAFKVFLLNHFTESVTAAQRRDYELFGFNVIELTGILSVLSSLGIVKNFPLEQIKAITADDEKTLKEIRLHILKELLAFESETFLAPSSAPEDFPRKTA